MESKSLRARSPIVADLVAFDVNEEPVLLVDVKGVRPVPESVTQLISSLNATEPAIPFGMLADPETISIFRSDVGTPPTPILSLEAAAVLVRYEPDYGLWPIYETYLTALLESWLRDLAIRWDSETPPAMDSIASIGLLPRLEDGTIEREVRLDRYALRGNQSLDELRDWP